MDVPRKNASKKRKIKRIVYGLVTVVGIAAITYGVSRLKPALMQVDSKTVLTGTVTRGPMVRNVRGIGTLIPENIRWIPAQSEGQVQELLVKPGAEVNADSILVILSNPQLEQSALEAGSQLQAGEADYKSLAVRLERQVLDQKAAAATIQSNYSQAKMEAEVNESLHKQGLLSELTFKKSKMLADELATRNEIEQKRLQIFADEVKTQLAAQQAQLEQRRALYELRKRQVAELRVRAGIKGVVQVVPVQVGQQVTAGTNLARVADPSVLKAELRIAETTKDLAIGQVAMIDTRNGIVQGHVVRIDPAAQNATIAVDVQLDGELPKNARPDMNVEGTITLQQLDNILYVNRPVQGQENSKVGLFRIEPDGVTAVRVTVQLGVSAVNTIEVRDGLKEGDKIILSDTSNFDNTDRIQLR